MTNTKRQINISIQIRNSKRIRWIWNLNFRIWSLFVFCNLCIGISPVFSQQTPQYTQFMLSNYGMNPAACVTSDNKIDALIGVRRQWIGFQNMPVTSFINVNTYLGRKGGGINYGWHGIGGYWQGDRMGRVIKTDDFYLSYSYLMRLMR